MVIDYLHMPHGSLGDQLCFITAARAYARTHSDRQVHVNVLQKVVAAYGDSLLGISTEGNSIQVDIEGRHRRKHESPDKTYVGTYFSALGLPVTSALAPELPAVPAFANLKDYVALQPYSTFARNPSDYRKFVQHLIYGIKQAQPTLPIICVGHAGTSQDWDGLDYKYLGDELAVLRVIRHAKKVFTPRSASAHIAAGYRVPAFLWLCGDGEDWHLDYPNWDTKRVTVDIAPREVEKIVFNWMRQ